MSKKDKKIEIQLSDATVLVGKEKYDGYTLTIGKKIIGEIAELDTQFAIIKNGNVDAFYKKLDQAVEVLIENYNLAKQCLFFVNFHDIINFVDCRRDSEEAKRGGL